MPTATPGDFPYVQNVVLDVCGVVARRRVPVDQDQTRMACLTPQMCFDSTPLSLLTN